MAIAEFTAALAAFNTTKDALKLAFNAKVDAERQEARIEALEQLGKAQDALYGLREKLFQMQEENEKLARELQAATDWKAKVDQFEMVQTTGNAVVFQYKGTPAYYACPSCMNEHFVEPLQDNRTMSGKYRCVRCKGEFPIDPGKKYPPLPRPQSYWPGA